MNSFNVTGRLTADPEIRHTQTTTVARFNFAVNRSYRKDGEPEADFFTCTAFGKNAENFEKLNITKGTKLLLEGEMRNNNYTDKDGVKHYGDQMVVNRFEFCESKKTAPESGQAELPPVDDFVQIPANFDDDDLPFK